MTASQGESDNPGSESPRATRRRVLGGAAAGGVAGLFASTLLQRASAQEAATLFEGWAIEREQRAGEG